MDNVTGLFILNGVCMVPAILNIGSSHRGMNRSLKLLTRLTDIASIFMQLSVCFIPFILETRESVPNELRWQLPLALFLVSLGYWESFAEIRRSKQSFLQWFYHGIRLMKKTRAKIYVTASLMKILILITAAVHLLPKSIDRNLYLRVFQPSPISYSDAMDSRITGRDHFNSYDDLFRVTYEVYIPLIVQVVSSCICYYTGRVACKVIEIS